MSTLKGRARCQYFRASFNETTPIGVARRGAVNKASNQLALIKSERIQISHHAIFERLPQKDGNLSCAELLPPACDLCASPMVAQITVTSEGETFRDVPVCRRHLNHLRMYIAAERAVEESKTA
jgi:hypothetical protein